MSSMRKNIALAGLLALTAACGEGGTPPTETSGTGEFVMTLARAANSTIPAQADSALVRVWRGSQVNAVKAVAIPAPGATTQVQFNLPANSGYSVGVLAFRFNVNGIGREGFAAGVTHNVDIVADQANQAAVNVAPVTLSRTGPDTMRAGVSSTFTFTFDNPAIATEEMLGNPYVRSRMTPWTSDSEFIPGGFVPNTATGFTYTVAGPTVDADSALYIQTRLMTGGGWTAPGVNPVMFYIPSLSLGQPLIRVPVKPASGSLTVVFDKKQ
jgi:hypothetical protein